MPATHIQGRVDRALRAIGGYWAPLAGLARLLEELGELAAATSLDERRHEAADCAVATLALANQYCVAISTPPPNWAGQGERGALIAASLLARLVNRFEGAKPPKPSEPGTPTLPTIMAGLLGGLAEAGELGFEALLEAAAGTAEANAERDARRFMPRVDPVTAPVRERFCAAVMTGKPGPATGVWGSAGDPGVERGEIERFLRVDAMHPLAALVFGPFSGAAELSSVAARIGEHSFARARIRVLAPSGQSDGFVLLIGSAPPPPLRDGYLLTNPA